MNTGCGRQLVTVINMLTPGVRDRHLLLDLNTRTREAALRQRFHRTARLIQRIFEVIAKTTVYLHEHSVNDIND